MFTLPRDIALVGFVWVQAGLHRDRGQTLAEYVILIGLVAVGTVLVALISFQTHLQTSFSRAADCLFGGCQP